MTNSTNQGERMKQYIGTKQINAKPMNRLEYNQFRGWELPTDENGADEGYLVEYVGPGQKPNTPDYAGYVSWSPKDVFEEAYKSADTYKERLAIELGDLNAKLEKLVRFTVSDTFNTLGAYEQATLTVQEHHMRHYAETLEKRLVYGK